MKTTSLRARTLGHALQSGTLKGTLCALLAGTAFCGLTAQPAAAQSQPAYRNLDSNGVDLSRGDFVAGVLEGSIGSGEAELALVRRWSGSQASQWDGLGFNKVAGGGTETATVGLDRTSEKFVASGGGFVSTLAMGSTLTGGTGAAGAGYTWQGRDGTTIVYDDPSGNPWGGATNLCKGAGQSVCSLLPTSISSPDGKSLTLSWTLHDRCWGDLETSIDCDYYWRLASVANSFGYSIVFAYQTDSASSGSAPPSGWFVRTGATFHNSAAGSGAQASAGYSHPSANVTDMTDIGGRSWRFTSSGTSLAIRRPGATSDTTSYTSGTGGVSSVTSDGVTTQYSRSVSGTTATMVVTNALGQQSTIVSDTTHGRPTSVTDALGRTTSYQYDGNGRLTRVTADEGNYVHYTLDARGNVTESRAVAKPGSGLADIVASASYDSSCSNPVTCNSPGSTTDARGNTTDYSYDPTHGGPLTVTGPAPTSGATRPQTRYGYTLTNGEYRLTQVSRCRTTASCAGTADEVKTTIAYNADGSIQSASTGAGDNSLVATSAMTYDAMGNLLTVDGPLSGTADTGRIRYNSAREVVGTISPDPDGAGPLKHRATRNVIDSTTGLVTRTETGNVDSQSDGDWAAFAPALAVEFGYDSNNRPVTGKLAAGGTPYALTQTGYDALGRPECSAQRMDSADFGSTLPNACTLTSPAGSHGPDRIVKTVYDLAGRVAQVRSALGVSGEEAAEVTYGYSDNGQTEYLVDAKGNRTQLIYDGHDRLVRANFPSATGPTAFNDSTPANALATAGAVNTGNYAENGYDPNGNLTTFRNRANETIAFTFDALDRVTLKNLPGSEPDVSYSYDLLGRLTGASQTGHSLGFTYDALGRTLTQTGPHGTVTSTFDIGGRRTRITHPDGYFADYEYLVTGETKVIRENGATSGVGVLATFGYDDLGRRTSLTRGSGSVTSYGYDAVSRLSQLSHDLPGTANDLVLGFSYNPASQIVQNTRSNNLYSWTQHGSGTTSTSADGLNRIASWNGTIGHDAKGNISAIGSSSYGYSSENLLTSAPGYTLTYDPLMRFHELAGTNPRRRVYDGDELIMEYHPNGTMQRRFVHGPGTDEPLVWYGGGGSVRRFLHADERGSIVSATDSAGAPVVTYRYDEYGGWGSGNSGTFYYTGQTGYTELGLYYYKNRWRHPKLDRFMQPDPIGYGGGMNLYAYVGADPVNFRDPSGTCTGTLWGRFRHNEDWSDHELLDTWWVWDTACYFGGSSGSDLGSGGSETQNADEQKVECKLGNGAIQVSFDGTTVNITTKINLVGPGAATSGAYIGGIREAWTQSFGHINSIANISAGLGGLTAHISSESYPPPNEHGHHGPRAERGGNNMWLGNLGAMPDWQKPFAIKHIGPHEFGHLLLGLDNMPSVGKWVGSIMSNSANKVSATDLEAAVEACRAAQ